MAEKVADSQVKKVNFLKTHNDLRSDWPEGKGFHVRANAQIQKADGSVRNVNEALAEAGFENGMEIEGYRVQKKDFEDRSGFVFKFFALSPPVVDDGAFA